MASPGGKWYGMVAQTAGHLHTAVSYTHGLHVLKHDVWHLFILVKRWNTERPYATAITDRPASLGTS